MNETIKKLSEEVVKAIADRVAQPEIQKAITSTKESKGSGRFRVVISTDDLDRHGESVDQNGLNIEKYMENPIVLWGHEHWSMPVGVTESISRDTVERDGKTVIRTIAEGYFVEADINPMGPQLARAYEAKVVTKTSIGMIVKEMIGNVISQSELLEFSFVPIPANPYTVDLMKQNALDMAAFKAAGILSEVKEGATQDDAQVPAEGPAAEPAAETPAAEATPSEAAPESPEPTETPAPAETEPTEPNNEPEKPEEAAPAAETPEIPAEPAVEAAPENPEGASAEATPGDTEVEKTETPDSTKAGRVLSAANEKKLKTAVESLAQATAALGEVLAAVTSDDEKNSEPGTGEVLPLEKTAAPQTKVETPQPGEAPELKSLDDWLAVRDILRSVETAARSALGAANLKIKEHKEK